MKINPVTLIITLVFLYPVLRGFLFKFSSKDLKIEIDDAGRNISFIIAIISGIYFGKKIFIQHDQGIYKRIYYYIPQQILNYLENNNLIIYAIVIPITVFIIYRIIKLLLDILNCVTFYPALDSIEKFLISKGNLFKRIIGMIFQLPKAVCYILLLTFILNILSMFNINDKLNGYLEASRTYETICKSIVIPVTNSTIAKNLPNILNNSFRIVIREANSQKEIQSNASIPLKQFDNRKAVVYYNGVTLDEGVKSNAQINKLARELGSEGTETIDKADNLYNWIGSNISYDHAKANKVLNNDFNVSSGAIPAFETRKGICFDYASLYVAMARANNLKVRLITGEGFNGVSWVSHAWNQVYIPEKGKWINVDTTFYKGGNYFNNSRFNLDHRNAQIAGEW
ncbi:transglutaminase domain-containing protein [Clostridium tyrobutyricum]|jgi:hypothetical protein|uniref:Transglutaminase-like enzyme, putative cysteine protease n=1 Tax=Clostridium tyrobutyricum DIVETGP TaxID=1408889 RepID=W6N8I5_CLOTY|nr:transglutaminase-like domain-containing protein [Clostridium tyrobutyricum]AND85786.1 transglutaminase-like cysteine protease [Clostridium tyrobutyricum]ANP70303.1 transglutaminase [Clostridium tyrobutyricum]MBR9648004.1 transglutaminase domain-containing protein [Clostridium tyrobutyricum]MBV4416384.1 transglutaminase-like domain-containing protein [Clostridium tyrobutyricum]MBV4423501.1 transglutaminase-like domain-containing protein [Clostridium tyrobutyricum]